MNTKDSQALGLPISKEILEPYIREAVSASILGVIGDGQQVVVAAVESALSEQVGPNGTRSGYSYENKHPFVEVLAKNAIQKVALETVNRMAEELRPQIETAVKSHLQKQHSKLAKTLVDGMVRSLSSQWSVKLSVNDD